MDRIYRSLGFWACTAVLPGCNSGSRVCLELTFADRLRTLVSGKIRVDIAHAMDPLPKRWVSAHRFSVLPPNYPLDGDA